MCAWVSLSLYEDVLDTSVAGSDDKPVWVTLYPHDNARALKAEILRVLVDGRGGRGGTVNSDHVRASCRLNCRVGTYLCFVTVFTSVFLACDHLLYCYARAVMCLLLALY